MFLSLTPAFCRRLFCSEDFTMSDLGFIIIVVCGWMLGMLGYCIGWKLGIKAGRGAVLDELEYISKAVTQDLQKIMRFFTEVDGNMIRVFRSDTKVFVSEGHSLEQITQNLIDQKILSFQVMHQGQVFLFLNGVNLTNHANNHDHV